MIQPQPPSITNTLKPVDISELALSVSFVATFHHPLRSTVSKVINPRTLQLVASADPVTPANFFPSGTSLTPDHIKTFFEYHRSFACHQFVTLLAATIHNVCKNGVPLVYEGSPVVDIYVLNCTEFELEDLIPNALHIQDKETSVTIPAVFTYAGMNYLRTLPAKTRENFSMGEIPVDDVAACNIRKYRPKSYQNSAPHWWICAVVESPSTTEPPVRTMVHLDICGSAYSRDAFRSVDGNVIPLELFSTQDLTIAPHPQLQHKFILHAYSSQPGPNNNNMSFRVMLPNKVRHFRCLNSNNGSSVELTTLETFLERFIGSEKSHQSKTTMDAFVEEMWSLTVMNAARGTTVVLRDLKNRPELNGKKGRINGAALKQVSGNRVQVLLEHLQTPISVKVSCISFLYDRRQYRLHEDLQREINCELKKVQELPNISKRERNAISSAMKRSDPSVSKAFEVIMSGKMFISSFGDPEFRTGVKQLLDAPLDKLFADPVKVNMRVGLEVGEHPSAGTAFKLIKMLRKAKLQDLEDSPALRSAGGDTEPQNNSQLKHLFLSVAKKIKADPGLNEVFCVMDEANLYPSPLKVVSMFV